MCSLAVGSVSCSACVSRRCLRCTIWAAALRTASSSNVCCCLHGAFRVFGEVSVQGLCHCPSHGGFFDQGVPEEVFGGLVCVAVGWPSFVLFQGFRRGPAH